MLLTAGRHLLQGALFLLGGLLLSAQVNAQVSGYTFSQSSVTYTPITGGTNIPSTSASALDDNVAGSFNIGFTFTYAGINYTQFGYNANGWISLGSASLTSSTSPLQTGITNNVISAFGVDLIGRQHFVVNRTGGSPTLTVTAGNTSNIVIGSSIAGTGIAAGATVTSVTPTTITMSANASTSGTGSHARVFSANSGVRYETLGVAPNRTLVVQWTGFSRYTTTASNGDNLNFQIRLNETTNSVEVVYSVAMPNASGSITPQVGLRGALNSDFNARTTTTNWSATTAGTTNGATCTYSNTVAPASGLTFTWTPPVPCSGTPTAAVIPGAQSICGGSSTVITATSFATGVTGLTFQWEESDDNGVGDAWANAVGGTGATTTSYTTPTLSATRFYRLRTSCTPSGLSSTSGACQVSVVPCTFNATRSTGITYTSIASTGTSVGSWRNGPTNTDDNLSDNIPIGFSFGYQGTTYTDMRVSTNGFATFNTATTALGGGFGAYGHANTNFTISAGTLLSLAPFYEDLVTPGNPFTAAGLANGIRYQTTGTSPNRVFTIEWIGMETFNNAGPNLNFQVKLYETSNNIEFVYGTMEGFAGGTTYTYSYSSGLNGSTMSGTPTATQLYTQQFANRNNFTNTAQNALLEVPECNSSILFTPGTSTANQTNFGVPANDEPAGALSLMVNPSPCGSFCGTYYRSLNATASAGITACVAATPGNPDDDVWFSFVATTSQQVITVRNSGGYDAVVQLFSDPGITSVNCVNASTAGGNNEAFTATGLTPGSTYYIRVYNAGTGSGTSNGQFSICLNEVVPPPANDDVCGAIALTVNTSCTTTAGSTLTATASAQTACGGAADDDIWYSFVAATTSDVVTVTGLTTFNAHVQIFGSSDNTCTGTLTSLTCTNSTGAGAAETYSGPWTVGNRYFVRVYHTLSGTGSGNLTICVTGVLPLCTSLTAPANAAIVVASPVSLSWAPSGNATGYDVFVDQSNPPTTLVSSNQAGLSFNYTPTNPTAGQTYFWTMVPRNALGTASNAPCAVRSFTLAAPACPVLTAPANGFSSTSGAETLTWNASTGATGYNVFLDNNPTPATQVSTNQAGLSFGPNASSTGLTYYWTVNAVGPYGTSVGCTVFSYNTNPPACVPSPTAPVNGGLVCANSGNVVLSWPASAGASGYDVVLDGNTVSTNQAGTSFDAGNLALGVHSWSITPRNGNGPASSCSTWSFTEVANPVIVLSPSPANAAVCNGSPVTLTASGASTYSWSPAIGLSSTSGASVTATPTAATTYTVSTTDGNGCQGTATQTVNVGSNPTIGAVTATPDVVCANSSSQLNASATTAVSTTAAGGAITIPSSGNSTPYPSTVNVSGLAGTLTSITVTLTNFSHSWPSDVDVALFGPTGAHSILFTDAIGGSGGIAGRTYTFQTGATALPTTGFPVSGTYGVVNGNAYSGTGTPSAVSNANLAIFNGTNPNGTWSLYVHDDFSFSGGSIGSWSITFNTTEPVTNFSWSPATFLNNTTISNPLASAITPPITYTATAASSIGCTATGSISINLATPLTAASITGTPAFCQGGSTTLTAVATGGGSYIYQWTGPSGPAGTASTQVVNQPGLWSVDITACGITQTASVNVIQNDLPAVTISPSPASAAVCNGAPVTLSATGGSSYTWSPAIGLSSTSGASVTATPTAAITYTVSTTDGNGCQGTATQLVGVGSNPSSVSASASPSTICSGSTSMLSGSAFVAVPPSAYSLTSGSGVFTPLTGATAVSAIQADDAISSNIPIGFSFSYNGTSYTNVRASSNGFLTFNTSALSSTAVNNMTSPGTSIIPMVAPLWDDLSGATTGTASYLTTGTAPNRVFTFEWLNWKWNYQATGAVISFQARLFETSGRIEFIYRQEPTAYNAGTTEGASIGLVGGTVGNFLSLIGTGTNPGTSAVTETNNLASRPANGQVYTFLPPALSFSWQPSGQVVNPTSASTATVALSSSQTYTLTASSNGCATTANVTVNLATPFTAASITGTPSFCQGGSTTLTAVAAGGTGYTYQWTGPSGPAGTASTQVANQPGAWSVDITACGITQTASVNVVQNALPAISISPAPASAAVCNGAPVTLTAAGATTYTWSPSAGLSGTAGATVTATPSLPATYTVTGTDGNGCQSTATQLVNVGQNPTASSVVSVTPLCAGSGTTITTTSSLNSFTISNNTGPISAAIPGTSLTGVFVDLPMSGGFGAIGASSSVRVTMSTAALTGQNNTIDAYLVGPGNCGTLELTTDNGGTGTNYSNAVFLTPGGGTNISTLSATNTSNITGTWSPEGSISAPPALNSGFFGSYSLPATSLTGCPVNGTWRLFVAADGLMVGGSVTNFQLQLGLASTGNFTMSASGPGTIGAATYSGIENSVGAIDVTNIPVGTHVYTVTTTAPSGCSTTSTATVTAVAPPTTAIVGGAQTICTNGMTTGLGGNTPTNGTGAWSIVSGGTGTFSPDASTPNATFTHTSGSGPVVLRWTITAALCPPSSADVAVTVVSCNACAGVPAPGNTTTTASVVCPSTSFTLGTSIAQLSSGLNFVWQSGPGSAGPWTTMATTTSNTYMVTGQSVMTWYRVRVNCLNSGQTGIAAPVSVAVDPFCFPSPPSPALPGDTFISSSTVGTGTQSSTCGALAPGSGSIAGRYSSYLNQPALTSLVRGTNTAFSINVSDCENSGFGTSKVAIYVDLNQNDVFEVSEEVFEGLPAVTNYTSSGTFNIPLSAPLGSTGMRIIAAETGADITPTLVFNEGEVEDYVVNIINPAAANDFLNTAQSVTTGAFPTCGTSLTALLPVATNSPESAGAGNDVWYTFTAVTNGLRVAVTGGVAPHNTQIELRNAGGIIATENDQLTNGHETMILDNLTPGLQYWVAITQLAGSSNATVCIQHLRVSSCDNPSVFNSTCTSYKSLATGANTYAVTFDDNGVAPFVATAASTAGITTIPLGSFAGLPAPTSVANYLVRVDATYDLNDAAGNPVTVVVPGTFSCTRTVNPHPGVFLRDSDASPNVRPSNALIGANTWLCGANIYQWTIQQFTAVNGSPLAPLPTVVNGPPTNRFLDLFPLGLVPNGIYKVNVRPIFPSGPGNQGPDRWLIIAGPAMMGEQEEEGVATLKDGVEAMIASALYPNPSNGSFVNLNITGVDANVMVRVLDGMGRVVWTSNLVVEGSLNTIIAFERPLASGLYMVEMTYDGQVV
ncbi:MAG: GEVED domain-containing protein, partial [Flavobacteriales bacterium]